MNEGCWHSKTFCHFLLWRGAFCFDVVGNFELKKMTPNCNALANWLFLTFESLTIHLFFLDSVKKCYLQTKKHAVTSSERAHSITWYKQKRRRNRWASKQVSRRYIKCLWIWRYWKRELIDINIYLSYVPQFNLVFIVKSW